MSWCCRSESEFRSKRSSVSTFPVQGSWHLDAAELTLNGFFALHFHPGGGGMWVALPDVGWLQLACSDRHRHVYPYPSRVTVFQSRRPAGRQPWLQRKWEAQVLWRFHFEVLS